MNDLNFIMRLEGDELTSAEEYIDGMAGLIKTGMIRELQGSYQRAAQSLIDQGFITPQGAVLKYHEDD
jgi:DNA primase